MKKQLTLFNRLEKINAALAYLEVRNNLKGLSDVGKMKLRMMRGRRKKLIKEIETIYYNAYKTL